MVAQNTPWAYSYVGHIIYVKPLFYTSALLSPKLSHSFQYKFCLQFYQFPWLTLYFSHLNAYVVMNIIKPLHKGIFLKKKKSYTVEQ